MEGQQPQGPPPGWYTNPQGPADERYWDGSQWTESFRSHGSGAPGGGLPPEWRKWLEWTRRHWVPVLAGLAGLFLGTVVGVSGAGEATTTTTTETTTVVQERTQTVTRTVTKRSKPRRVTVTQTRTETVPGGSDDGGGGGGGGSCDENYSGCVPPAALGDVNCPEVDGPVQVIGSDPHGLDRDGDGSACE